MEIENIVAIKEPSRSGNASGLITNKTPNKPRLVDQKGDCSTCEAQIRVSARCLG